MAELGACAAGPTEQARHLPAKDVRHLDDGYSAECGGRRREAAEDAFFGQKGSETLWQLASRIS